MTSSRRGLTVATYNLYLGADLAVLFDVASPEQLTRQVAVVRDQLAMTAFEERAEAVARILVRERVDVVGLQEVSRWTLAPLSAGGAIGAEEVVVDFLPTLLGALARAGTPYDAVPWCRGSAVASPSTTPGWRLPARTSSCSDAMARSASRRVARARTATSTSCAPVWVDWSSRSAGRGALRRGRCRGRGGGGCGGGCGGRRGGRGGDGCDGLCDGDRR